MKLVTELERFAHPLTKLSVVWAGDESIDGQSARWILILGWHSLGGFYADSLGIIAKVCLLFLMIGF